MTRMAGPDRPADLVANLAHAECFPHPVRRIQALETHISWVVLTGDYAYKIKKPVTLPFLDFATLDARRHYCEEELRLNRRYAPDLYLDVVPIGGSPAAPRIGEVPALEYAVRMREFAQDALASSVLARGGLTPEHLEALAERLAAFHADAERAARTSPYGTPEMVGRFALDNFRQIEPLIGEAQDRTALARLREWTAGALANDHEAIAARRTRGMVRECHGDLHLGNVVLLDGALMPFDCIEFNADLRWIDVMSEAAFLMMDLFDRGAPQLAWSFLNPYVEATGDYEGLALLRFYLVYRATVRAKVHLLRARQPGIAAGGQARLLAAFREYLELAAACSRARAPALVLMHGYAGCGKSTVALWLARHAGAIRIRSDVERKRLHGLGPLARSASLPGRGLYGEHATAATYAHLADIAAVVLAAGHVAIVDATFLKAAQRAALCEVARSRRVPAAIVRVHAPEPVLRSRIAARARAARDPSEATVEVLARQQAQAEPIAATEGLHVFDVDGTRRPQAGDLEPLCGWLAQCNRPS